MPKRPAAVPRTQTWSGSLVGAWAATSVELVSLDDGSVRVDLVSELGATLTLTLAEAGDFTMVLDYAGGGPGGPWGEDQTITGTWNSTDVLTLQTSPTSQWQFEAVLTGTTLTLSDADTSFDFGDDGTIEDAKLGMALVRD
jgi:hypothetical protein